MNIIAILRIAIKYFFATTTTPIPTSTPIFTIHLLGSVHHESARFGQGEGPIFLDDVQCSGIERSLLYCRHSIIGNNNCSHSQDIGVTCPS